MFLLERAKELADIVGADPLTLADLNNFHPEDGMILANTTSIGMQPKVDETPISKVCLLSCFLTVLSSFLKEVLKLMLSFIHTINSP